MKMVFIIVLFFIIFNVVNAQTPDWQWATKVGGINYCHSFGIAIDDNGNSYITGYYVDTATFGSYSLPYIGAADIFAAKMDINGNWLWATKAGGNNNDHGYGIAIDADGNSYVTGRFRDTATFGSYSLTSSGDADIFVAKIDLNGNWLWATKAGGIDWDFGKGIAIDDNGNSYVIGYFEDTATFGSYSLTSSGVSDIFVAKMDANGNWLWASKAGGSSYDYGFGIVLDDIGNSYLTGMFQDTATFGSYPLTSSGDFDIFVAKMNTNGNWLCVTKAGGSDWDEGSSIVIDDNGNSYVTGYFESTATFGSYFLTSSGDFDIFVAKMDSNGNWLWASKAGGSNEDIGTSIAIDDNGISYVTGYFFNTAIFGTSSLISSGNRDIFVAKLNSDTPLPVTLSSFTVIQTSENQAQINWTTQSENGLLGYNIYRSENDNYNNSMIHNSSLLTPTNSSTVQNYSFVDENVEFNQTYFYWLESVEYSGNTELFGAISVIIEYQPDNPTPPSVEITELQQNYPNPFNPKTTINFAVKDGETAQLLIYNVKGQIVKTYTDFENGFHTVDWNGKDDLGNQVGSGLYFYRLKSATTNQIRRMILLK
ncbi:MAG: SBBP repeat-containing protein [Candidatus Cloacimonetes bacterium]|nr:SBBP repeat-containing protein [Candidatus Cloacimonadota bacterium]